MSEFKYDQPASHKEEFAYSMAVTLGWMGVKERERDFSTTRATLIGIEFPSVVSDLLPKSDEALRTANISHNPEPCIVFSQYESRNEGNETMNRATHVGYKLLNVGGGLERFVTTVVKPLNDDVLDEPAVPKDYAPKYDDVVTLGWESGFTRPSAEEMRRVTDWISDAFPHYTAKPKVEMGGHDGPPAAFRIERFVDLTNEARTRAALTARDASASVEMRSNDWWAIDADKLPVMTRDLLPMWSDVVEVVRVCQNGPPKVEFGRMRCEVTETGAFRMKIAKVEYSLEVNEHGEQSMSRRVGAECTVDGTPLPIPDAGESALGVEFGFTIPSDVEMSWVNDALQSIFSRPEW